MTGWPARSVIIFGNRSHFWSCRWDREQAVASMDSTGRMGSTALSSFFCDEVFQHIYMQYIYIYIHVPIEFNLTHPYPYPNLHFVKGLSNHVFLLCHRLVDLYVLFKYNVSHPGVVVLILWNNISRLSNQIKSDEVVFIIYYHHPRFMIWQNISCRNIIYDARIHPHTNKSVQDSLNISKMLSALTLHAAVRVFLGAWRNRRESVQWRHSLEGNVSNCSASWSKVGNSGASRIVEISLYQKSWCSSDASRWNQ